MLVFDRTDLCVVVSLAVVQVVVDTGGLRRSSCCAGCAAGVLIFTCCRNLLGNVASASCHFDVWRLIGWTGDLVCV